MLPSVVVIVACVYLSGAAFTFAAANSVASVCSAVNPLPVYAAAACAYAYVARKGSISIYDSTGRNRLY